MFEPDPSGTTTLIWLERFYPDHPEKDPVDTERTYVYQGDGPGPVDSPVYNLMEPDENGTKQIVTNTFSATFDLCPVGTYEFRFTYFDSNGNQIGSDSERRHVPDVSKPYTIVKVLPQGVTSASQISVVATLNQAGRAGDDDGGNASSVSWSVFMGFYDNGNSAGAIRLYDEFLTGATYTPAVLSYNMVGQPEIDAVFNSSGHLRQVFAPEALADIVTASGYYEISFYRPGDVDGFDQQSGLYTLKQSASAFSIWRVDNPEPANMTRLRMRQMVGSNGLTRLFSYDVANNKWSLETGGGLRTLSRESVTSGDERTRTTIISDPVYGDVTKTVETYFAYPWGEERIEEVRDPNGRALTTTWDFYDDDQADGWRYGLLKSRLDPTGHWEFYDYDGLGRRSKTISSWKGSSLANVANESLHRVQRIAYREEDLNGDGFLDEIQRTVEEIESQKISRRYRVEWGQSLDEPNPEWSPGQPYLPPFRLKSVSNIRVGTVWGDPDPDDPANLTTTTHTYTSGPWTGRTRRILHPDGTATILSYSLDDANLTTRQYHGEPVSTGALVDGIYSGRVTITVIDDAGNRISETEKSLEETSVGLTTLSPGGGGGLLPEEPVTMPASGANAVYVGRDPQGQLEFRIFDRDGQILVNENEANLSAQADAIADLKGQLDSLWSEPTLTLAQQRAIIAAVKPILDIDGIDSGVTINQRIVQSADDFGRPLVVSYPLDGTSETFVYGDFGEIASHTARDGNVTINTPDALGRIFRTTRNGIAEEYSLDGNGRRRTVTRIGTDQSTVLLQENHFDLAGDLAWSQDVAGETTTYTEEPDNGLWKRGVEFPDSGKRIELTYSDGTLFKVEGSAVAHRQYEYGTTTAGERWTKEILLRDGPTATDEWVKTYTDMLGRTVRREYADSEEEVWEFNDLGQLIEHRDPDGVTRRFAYNAHGELEITATVIDETTGISFGGEDRVRQTTRRVLSAGHPENTRGEDIVVTIEKAWTQNNVDAAEVLSRHETTTSGLRSWEIRGGVTSSTLVNNDFSGSTPTRTVHSTRPDGSYSIVEYVGGELGSEARHGSDGTLLHQTEYEYDPHGRLEFADDLRNGRTTFQYDGADRLWKVTTPAPGPGQSSQTTEYGYGKMGRQNKVIHPDTAETHFEYCPNGKLKTTWGDRTYRVAYTYDLQGRKETMKTWQDYPSGEALTTWNYHPHRGWLENKRYQDNTGPSYTYWPSGRLKTRTWARQVNGQDLVTTYIYNEAGDLWTVTYSDGTPSVTHTYDRLGRLKTTTDAAGLLTRGYTAAGALEYEDYTGAGLLSGVSIDRGYDSAQRRRVLATDAGYSATYLFDAAGRLNQIAEGHHRADLGYELGTEILQSTLIRRVGTPRLYHERSVDKLGRVEWMKTIVDGATAVHRDYTYNAANQRTIVEHEDGRAWHYGYDSLGQVESAAKRLSADPQSAILPGYSFGYQFDGIGNRESATRNSRTPTYTPNLLNQYEEREVPGYVDVLGEAHATAAVTVDGQPTDRTGRDFRREITVANSGGPVYTHVEVEAEFDSQIVDETRHAFVPKTPEIFVHDADGNLSNDGRWTYEWDAENRLRAMETIATVASAFPSLKQRLEFAYDFQGRRIQKIVKNWDAGTNDWESVEDLRFVYDDWLLVEERDALNGNAVTRRHVWGPDLSGSMQGAGGVGGLLWTEGPQQTFAASTDASGNIIAWVNTATLALAGRADYTPFGEPVVQTGVSKEMPFGFSSKYEDAETGLVYYGNRLLDPPTGRWLSRDPIEERGGINLQGFVGNDPVNRVDFLGLYSLIFSMNETPKGWGNPPFFGARLDKAAPWTGPRRTAVIQAQEEAIRLSINVIPLIGQYLDEIPDLYCKSRGRDILSNQVRYVLGTFGGAVSIMQSSNSLYVSPGKGTGGAAFVFPDQLSDHVWFTGTFFGMGLVGRGEVFTHEVVDLIGRAPGRAHTNEDVRRQDGWHRVANFYSTLAGGPGNSGRYETVRIEMETKPATDINWKLINVSGSKCEIIRRKDGRELGF